MGQNLSRSFLAPLALVLGSVGAMAPAATALAQPDAGPGQAERFDNHKVVRVTIRTVDDLALMETISPDPWSCRQGIGPVDYRIPPAQLPALDASGLLYHVLIDNVQALIDAETARILGARGLEGGGDLAWFSDFKNPAQVSSYVDTLVALRPDMASRVNVGTSVEGRTIYAIQIAAPGSPANKPIIFLNSVQHAREWVTTMSSMYIADRAVRTYGSDPAVTNILDKFTFIIVPITNADGYEFSWTTTRLWRKNRRINGVSGGGQTIYGVDLNRNWGFGWGVNIPGSNPGSSSNRSSETYRGTAAFSEPETQAVRDFIIARPSIMGTVDIHSYSQLILSPYGYTNVPHPRHSLFTDLNAVYRAGIASANGLLYTAGNTFTTIYPAAGTMGDWATGDRSIFGWSMEQRDTGQFGFILPADQIIPSAEEAMSGIFAWADALGNPIRITIASGVPALVASNSATTLNVTVSALQRAVVSGSPAIEARVTRSGELVTTSLTPVVGSASGEDYTATLPAASCGTGLQFAITAVAASGATVRLPAVGFYAVFTATGSAPNLTPCPRCPSDFNLDGATDPDDLADFIGAFFSNTPDSDFDASGTIDPDDLADFIGAFFAACP